ncbi:hypothetical protein [Flavobacterium sp.]|uniref:hypothetical protein n=1 Tax=Flavobacterium sp. TaxID=239 RepID=UPI0012030CC5|nr:hypothetical protein [Flavobacterium sp.]RZJ69006.1 MAG: hypothetical protein EOO49_18855 [Flavobacterium sp.]
MCKTSNTYKLCTCEGELDKAETIWRLTRFLGLSELEIMGSIVAPSEIFENGISASDLLRQMNSGNCFDLEYHPSENDSLQVSSQKSGYEYFDLIFRNGKWESGSNPHFTSILETVAKGKVETSDD